MISRRAARKHGPENGVSPEADADATVKKTWNLLAATYDVWSDRAAMRLGASVAFYAIFSITPLVLTTLLVAGWALGVHFARLEFLHQLQDLLGDAAAEAVETLLNAAEKSADKGPWAGITGAVTLIVGASGVFTELRNALDAIHGTKARSGKDFITWFVHGRLWSFALVLAIGFLLLASLIASAVIAAMGGWLTAMFPVLGFVAIAFNVGLTLVILTVLFALLMRWLPTERQTWRSVWPGAILASVLMEVGKELVGLYLGRAAFSDAFGAAGSLVVLVMWIYFVVQVFLVGAAFNEARSARRERARSTRSGGAGRGGRVLPAGQGRS
jgi:membrane protein